MRPYGMRELSVLACVGACAGALWFTTHAADTAVAITAPHAALVAASGVQPEGPRPSCTLTAQPMRIAYGGGTVLRWKTDSAQEVRLPGVGTLPLEGTRIVNGITTDRTFTMDVKGPGGVASCKVSVTVLDPLAEPTCLISAAPAYVTEGETVQLAWGSEGGTSTFLDGVQVSSQGGTTLTATRSKRYALSVFGPLGQIATCAAEVTVR